MFGKMLKRFTDIDPTGIGAFTTSTIDTAVGTGVQVSKLAVAKAMNPVQTLSDGYDFLDQVVRGGVITVQGIELEIDGIEAVEIIYNAMVPKTAQAILQGRLPSQKDYVDDAVAFVGGPIEGIYVAANSESAYLITQGKTPSAEQLGRDMFAALTPVALAKLGL